MYKKTDKDRPPDLSISWGNVSPNEVSTLIHMMLYINSFKFSVVYIKK